MDENLAGASRTCVPAPPPLRILTSLAVAVPREWRGRTIERLAIYTEGQRRSVLELPAAAEVSAAATTLPEDVLRRALTSRLAELGTDVEWKTRLVALAQDSQRVRVGIVRTERAPRPSLRPEWSDMSAETFDAEFVVGADGVRSSVRKILGIEFVSMGRRQAFSFYDAPDARAGDEAHLVIAEGTVNGVYPLQNMSSRFGFELGVGMVPPLGVERLRQLLEARMPWYASQADGFEWSGSAEFHPALA